MRSIPHRIITIDEVNKKYPTVCIVYRDRQGEHTVVTGAGLSDMIDVFRDGVYTYVLNRNCRLGYVGMDIYQGSKHIEEIFLQNHCDIRDVLGEMGLELLPINIVKKLRNYICER